MYGCRCLSLELKRLLADIVRYMRFMMLVFIFDFWELLHALSVNRRELHLARVATQMIRRLRAIFMEALLHLQSHMQLERCFQALLRFETNFRLKERLLRRFRLFLGQYEARARGCLRILRRLLLWGTFADRGLLLSRRLVVLKYLIN